MEANSLLILAKMSRFTVVLSLLFNLSSFVCSAQLAPKGRGPSPDEKLIEAQVNRLVADWNTHEFNHLDSYATDDVDWVNLVGMWWKGRPEVKQAHQTGFDYFFKGVPFTRTGLTVRFLTSEVALAHLLCHVGSLFPPDGIDRGTNRTPETDNILTLVYVKRKGVWVLTAGQNTGINPKATKLPTTE
ncbi:MAG: SgcJ/EcaC family oxidoreductase [Hymenobacter sp.]|nr:MAG: SgcJ/EcaC family oxidoreductase [Hymenobacter sp.]